MAKGLFGDLDKWFDDNRQAPQHSQGSRHGIKMPASASPEDIAKAIGKELGLDTKVLKSGLGMGIAIEAKGKMVTTPYEVMFRQLSLALLHVGLAAKAKPYCVDAAGNKLAVGDELKLLDGESKFVLQLGYGFAVLSHTEDKAKDDGVWFESEIKQLNLIKIKK